MNWQEKLPANCPPSDAESPNGKTFYRLCRNNPPDGSDFISVNAESPNRTFAGVSICQLKAVSLWDDISRCASLKKFKTQRGKIVGEITLHNKDGVIKKTNGPHHFSWWRSNQFNPNIAVIVKH